MSIDAQVQIGSFRPGDDPDLIGLHGYGERDDNLRCVAFLDWLAV